MLKSNKGYNLALNAKKKISTKFTKIMAIFLMATTFATVPVMLSSCGQEVAIHQSLPSISEKEMSAYVVEYFKTPPVGSLSNPTSIAYSISASDGKVYEINIVSTSKKQDGSVPVYLTTLEFPQGLSEREIEKKQKTYSSNFSNVEVKTFKDGEPVELETIYSSNLGENYIVAKEYEKSVESGIEL